MTGRSRRREAIGLVVAATIAGALFVTSLDDLWPLPGLPLDPPRAGLLDAGRAVLGRLGATVGDAPGAVSLDLDTAPLDLVTARHGRDAARRLLAEGAPLLRHVAIYKRRGETTAWRVDLHPTGRVLGWRETLEDDTPGPDVPVAVARDLALAAMRDVLGVDPARLEERTAATERRVARTDHRFVYERDLDLGPTDGDEPLRERVTVVVAGDRATAAAREWIVPAAERRDARAAEAPGRALEAIGFALVALGAAGAFIVFLRRLSGGAVRLGRAAFWPLVVFGCLLTTYSLEGAQSFASWEPLWPRWVSMLRYVVFRSIFDAWVPLVLLAVVGAGFAVDERLNPGRRGRGASLAALARGHMLDPGVVAASWRGFLIGLICGGSMAAAVRLLQAGVGAETALQPRGFFLYPLDSSAPAVTTLLFFLGVALAEELGYRFFAGSWLLELGAGRFAAAVLPAIVYGLSHTRLDFLPPAAPFWARPLVLTLVGCVWGWAFLRFDALTVVLSHYTADLFIFNWPRLADAGPAARAAAVAVILVPLLPALVAPLARRRRHGPV